MRQVSFAFLFLCLCSVGLCAQTRAPDVGKANAQTTGEHAAPAASQKPLDLHVESLRRRVAQARGRAEQARLRALRLLPEVRMFCENNVSTAGAARVAWQAAKLEELEARLQQKIAELEAKRAAYEAWLKKRDDALKKVGEQVVAIYSKMEPEAAANELSQMDDATAAAVLIKLKTRNASAILGEMDPAHAAHLTDEMIGTDLTDGKKS